MRAMVLGLGLAGILACGSDTSDSTATGSTGPTTPLFSPVSSLDDLDQAHFFDHPWPSDLRRDPDGSAHFKGIPNPFVLPILDAYAGVTVGMLHGFSPAAPSYLRFSGPIDPSTLPADPPASAKADASVQMIDIDPASPEHGQRRMIATRWQEEEGAYWQPDTLAIMPIVGRPLRPSTKYALVATDKLKAKDGSAIVPNDTLKEALGLTDFTGTSTARDLFAPALGELAAAGIQATQIVHMTVFTTNDPTAETFAAMDDVMVHVGAPNVDASSWIAKEQRTNYDVYEGTYGPSPNYQAGTAPYSKDGGGFVLNAGAPVLQNTFELRFALVVPNAQNCPAPAGGYPVVLYAHGTGGDYRSYIDDGTADALAAQCLASMGIDQIFHGTRPGAPPENDPNRESKIELLFFNFDNPIAGRTSNRQAAIDLVQQARLFTESATTIPASVSRTGANIVFDGAKVTFFGHSQGGLNGPLFFAGSDLAKGGVLSGSGAMLEEALLTKTKPVDIPGFVHILLGLGNPDQAAELDLFHPAMMLIQSIIDVADPVHYASFIVRAPRDGKPPKSVYMTEGVTADGSGDTYAPPETIEAHAVAIGLPRVSPGLHPIEADAWLGIADVDVPSGGLSGNLANGAATGVLAQFVPKAGSDGHFVVFDIPAARTQAAKFCATLTVQP